MESRVAAERIEGGVGLQKGDARRPVIKGLVEGFQSLIFVADQCRKSGDSKVLRRKCSFLLLRFQGRPLPLQNALPASVLVVRIKSVYQFTAGTRLPVEFHKPLKSPRMVAFRMVCQPEVVVSRDETWVHFDHAFQFFDRFIMTPSQVKDPTVNSVMEYVCWIIIDRRLHRGDSFVEAAVIGQTIAVPAIGVIGRWIEFDRAEKVFFAFRKVPTKIGIENAENRISLREVGIKLQCTLERGPGYLVFNIRRIIAHM